MRRLANWLAAKCGYVPAERLAEAVSHPAWWNEPTPEYQWLDTRTSVVTPPQTVVVNADFKRNKLCS